MAFPKNDKTFYWTNHVKGKMMFYRLSAQKIRQVFNDPKREEEGIAPKTFAAMRRNDTKKRKEEIWVMYCRLLPSSEKFKVKSSKVILISAWRYPGISKRGKQIPIPEEILNEIKKEWF